jgi:hypothetical protein
VQVKTLEQNFAKARFSSDETLIAICDATRLDMTRELIEVNSVNLVNALSSAIDGLDATSKPGFPYKMMVDNNGEVKRSLKWEFFCMAVAMIFSRYAVFMRIRSGEKFTAMDLVKLGACDPQKVHIKDELTGKVKADVGKWRLIWGVSVVQSLADSFSLLPDKVHATFPERVPMKPGTALGTIAGDRQLCQSLFYDGPLRSDDASSWDILMSWKLALEEIIVRYGWFWPDMIKCLHLDPMCTPDPAWGLLYMMQFTQFLGVPVFSDGIMFEQNFLSIRKSGARNTASGNSIGRLILAVEHDRSFGLKNIKHYATYGDDCVKPYVSDKETEWMADRGVIVKVSREKVNQFDFCSRLYGRELKNVDGFETVVYKSGYMNYIRALGSYLFEEPSEDIIKGLRETLTGPWWQAFIDSLPSQSGVWEDGPHKNIN